MESLVSERKKNSGAGSGQVLGVVPLIPDSAGMPVEQRISSLESTKLQR